MTKDTIIVESKTSLKQIKRMPNYLIKKYQIWCNLLVEHGHSILLDFPGYHDEKLQGELADYRSSRLNKQWRVIYSVDQESKVTVINILKITPHKY